MKIKTIKNTYRKKTPEEQKREEQEFQDKQEFKYANLYFLGTITFILLVSMLGLTSFTDDYLYVALISQAIYLVPLLIYFVMANKRLGVANRTGIKKVSAVQVLISACIGFCIIPFLNLINGISLLLVKDVTTTKVTEAAAKHNPFIMLLAVGIIPPIVEELSYRGAYFTAYRRSGVLKGALVSALLFGLMHGNLNQFAYAVVAGFLFAMIVYAGGSTICTIIIHVIINSVSLTSLYYDKISFRFPKFIVDSETEIADWKYVQGLILPGIISIVLVMIAFYLLRKTNKKVEEETFSKARIIDATMIVGIIIMVINIIAAEILVRQV